jgi:hypothetical protein
MRLAKAPVNKVPRSFFPRHYITGFNDEILGKMAAAGSKLFIKSPIGIAVISLVVIGGVFTAVFVPIYILKIRPGAKGNTNTESSPTKAPGDKVPSPPPPSVPTINQGKVATLTDDQVLEVVTRLQQHQKYAEQADSLETAQPSLVELNNTDQVVLEALALKVKDPQQRQFIQDLAKAQVNLKKVVDVANAPVQPGEMEGIKQTMDDLKGVVAFKPKVLENMEKVTKAPVSSPSSTEKEDTTDSPPLQQDQEKDQKPETPTTSKPKEEEEEKPKGPAQPAPPRQVVRSVSKPDPNQIVAKARSLKPTSNASAVQPTPAQPALGNAPKPAPAGPRGMPTRPLPPKPEPSPPLPATPPGRAAPKSPSTPGLGASAPSSSTSSTATAEAPNVAFDSVTPSTRLDNVNKDRAKGAWQ